MRQFRAGVPRNRFEVPLPTRGLKQTIPGSQGDISGILEETSVPHIGAWNVLKQRTNKCDGNQVHFARLDLTK